MAALAVDLAEAVDVDEQHGDAALGAAQPLPEPREELEAIRQVGYRVELARFGLNG